MLTYKSSGIALAALLALALLAGLQASHGGAAIIEGIRQAGQSAVHVLQTLGHALHSSRMVAGLASLALIGAIIGRGLGRR